MKIDSENYPNVDDIEAKDIDNENEDYGLLADYNFTTQTLNYTAKNLIQELNDKTIDIPDFQRQEVWNKEKQSLLIFSMLKGFPIPPIYYFDTGLGTFEILDGLQRISSIKNFYEGNLALKLPHLKNYDGKTIKNYPNFATKIVVGLAVTQQQPQNSQDGKYLIFRLLNQNPTPLNSQEIRNITHRGKFLDFVYNTLNLDSNWRIIFNKDLQKTRFKDVELILRTLVMLFLTELTDVQDMSGAINKLLFKYNKLSSSDFDDLTEKIKHTFTEVCQIVVDNKLTDTEGGKYQNSETLKPLNQAVRFDGIFGAMLKLYKIGKLETLNLKQKIVNINNNADFHKHIFRGTHDIKSITGRLKVATEELLKSITE